MKKNSVHITNLLWRLHNIDVSRFDVSFLTRSFNKRMTETHCNSVEEYYSLLEQNKNEAEDFLHSLNISYSEFFRNSLTFSVLERIILPALIQKKKDTRHKEIRIWSAACASGQESYSLAMLLEELINSDSEKINYRIFATDQCESQVNDAWKGQYSADSLNNLNLKRVKQWFTKHGDIYTVKQELKKNIDFSVFDLLNEKLSSPPSSIFCDFDLVLCANLLFYYKPEFRKIILGKSTNSLANGGYLITGETERDILVRHNYHEVFPHSAIFQKGNKQKKMKIKKSQ